MKKTSGGFTKTFPDIPCVSQMSGGLSLPAQHSLQDGLASRQDHEKVGVPLVDWSRGIVHCVLIQHL